MSFKSSSILANPVVVYVGVWSFVLVLFSLGLVNHFVEPTPVGLVTVFFGFLTSFSAFFISAHWPPNRKILSIDLCIGSLNRFVMILLIIWGLGSFVDVLYSGGVPLQWVIMGWEGKNYTDFGIPTLHGMLNACYLQAVTILFYCWMVRKKRRDGILICILSFWPVMMLGRGIFLSAALQMVAVYLIMHRVRFKSIVGILISVMVLVVLFGVLGDMRDTPNPFDYLVEDKAKDFFDFFPSGFLWVYVYSTSSINNLFSNIDSVIPVGFPVYSISNMFPSVFRIAFGMDPRNDQFDFVDQNLNTSTIYAGYVSDFGPIGAVILVFVIQLMAAGFYFKARTRDIAGVLGYSVMFQVLLFSVFYDMFFLLPTLMQLYIVFVFRGYCRRGVSC